MIKEDSAEKTTVETSPPQLTKKGVVMDGFTRRTPSSRAPVAHVKTAQKSTTLMRNVVKKPQPHTTPTASTKKPEHLLQKQSAQVPHARQVHAQATPKNPMVKKYSTPHVESTVVKKVEHLPVKQPSPQAQQTHGKSPDNQKSNASTRPRTHKSDVAVQRALAQAKAHQQEPIHIPHHSKTKRKLSHKLGISPRAVSLSMSVLAVALLAGFFAVQNVPNISMRVAAARAGISADMPNYTPSGFGFKGPIHYSSGQVTINFASHTDDRSYVIRQKDSAWNSDALLANYVVAENKQYQTYIDRGRTLYIYDGSNATWVDDGIWYQIEGDSKMTTDQLVRIAASI